MILRRVSSQRCILLIFLSACFLLFGNLFVEWFKLGKTPQIVKNNVERITKPNTILVWHWPWDAPYDLSGDFCKDKFGVPNCQMTDDRSRYPEADLVVIHNWEVVRGEQKLPTDLKRKESQRWVWLTMESPLYNLDVKPFAGLFNWTMTYHRDADIYSPYGFMVPRDTISTEPLENFIPKNKTHLVCWAISNYSPKHERTAIYDKLKTVVPIELYGRFVDKRISGDTLVPTISKCYFYLAFENSIFRDYITEKLYRNSFEAGAVPVVYGTSREEYEAVVPKDSFIHVNDFSTVEALGNFLKDLAKDKDRYASYFNWRRKYTVTNKHWTELLCRFCPKIHSMPAHKVYDDLDAWQH